MRKIRHLILLAALLPMVIVSCHKDKEEDYNYMTGTLTFEINEYVAKGVTYTLTPTGITAPTTGIGYSWKPSWSTKRDTTKLKDGPGDGSWTVTTPTAVGEYTISCSGFADDYVSSSASKTIYVVDSQLDSTVSGLGFKDVPSFTDSRDGSSYYTTEFGDNLWMRENLRYDTKKSVSYSRSSVMDDIFGKYYSWDEAMTACPDGWHLPSDEEFAQLADSIVAGGTNFQKQEEFKNAAGGMMVNAYFFGKRMWEYWPQVKVTNKSGLSVIPVGYVSVQNESYKFKGLNNYAVFWTADSNDEDGTALIRYIYVTDADVHAAFMDKDVLASVRCVKDK